MVVFNSNPGSICSRDRHWVIYTFLYNFNVNTTFGVAKFTLKLHIT